MSVESLYVAFMVIEIQVVVFQLSMPYSDVVGYQCFRGPNCLHL